MFFDKGYISPFFVTNPDTMECVFDNPYILITDKKISSMKDILPILEKTVQTSRPLLIISEDMDSEALATLVVNKMRAGLRVAAVKAPAFGDRRKEVLEDIAILTGGVYISEDRGHKIENAELNQMGSCEKVTIGKDTTTIIGGSGKKSDIELRVNQIKSQIEKVTSDYDKEKLQERMASLSGGVGVIYVGASTETEMKEKKDRIDDALHATRAAVEEGIVPGGGTAYIRAIESISELDLHGDEMTGANIIKKSLEEPLRQIVQNAGGDEGSIIINGVKNGKGDYGYNARKGEFENLLKSGVIDPTKVTRVALQNASSIASMFLTTECVIAEIPEDDKTKQPDMGGMM